MIGSSELMDALRGIGLNLYERKLWVALLTKKTATAGELSSIASVPRSRTYDVLQTLADRGFVIIQPSKPLKYVAVPPDEALKKAKQNLREEFKQEEKKIDLIAESGLMDELNELYEQGLELVSPEEITGALKGRYSVVQQLDSMLNGASSSVNMVTTPAGLNDLFENHISKLKELSDKGVNIRIASRIDKSCSDALKALSGIAEIRDISGKEIPLSGRFCVVDGQQLMMGLSDPELVHSSQDMVFWTKSKHAAGKTIEPLFNLIWDKAKPSDKKAG